MSDEMFKITYTAVYRIPQVTGSEPGWWEIINVELVERGE